jgi:hypothetical protein
MLRLLADENFNGDIVRGLKFHAPQIDIVRVPDVGLAGASDSEVLSWAGVNGRILLTHDRATLPGCAYACIADGAVVAGVFVLSDRMPVGKAVHEILLMSACSDVKEWSGRVAYLPL